jgi:hypothetical protein
MSVSQLFSHHSLHIVHILIYAVYPGSNRSYLPEYTTAQPLRLMYGVHDLMLDTGFDPGLWGSVSVSYLLLRNTFHTTALHILMPDLGLGSPYVSGPEYVVICMHEKFMIHSPHPRTGM